MTKVPQHIRDFLVKNFIDKNNGLINCETIITINDKYNLNLNINYEKPSDDIIPSMIRCNCLDKFIFMELSTDPNLPFDIIIKIINNRIEMDNNNPFNPSIDG
jgi:hypothetical protein